MFEFAGAWEQPINYIFLAVTAIVAIHGIRWRDKDGKPDTVRLLFGCMPPCSSSWCRYRTSSRWSNSPENPVYWGISAPVDRRLSYAGRLRRINLPSNPGHYVGGSIGNPK